MTTYIIESPNGETHKLEVFRTATGFSVYVDGSNICESITEEYFNKFVSSVDRSLLPDSITIKMK